MNLHHTHELIQRVYYEDTDFSGLVYHAAYLKFLERGRTEWLRENGMEHKKLFANGIAFVVHHLAITFHLGANMDDEILIATRVHSSTAASLVFAQTIHHIHRKINGHPERLLISAEVSVAAINAERKPLRLAKVLGKL